MDLMKLRRTSKWNMRQKEPVHITQVTVQDHTANMVLTDTMSVVL